MLVECVNMSMVKFVCFKKFQNRKKKIFYKRAEIRPIKTISHSKSCSFEHTVENYSVQTLINVYRIRSFYKKIHFIRDLHVESRKNKKLLELHYDYFSE